MSDPLSSNAGTFFDGLANPAAVADSKNDLIRQTLLKRSSWIKSPWFDAIGVDDLVLLFALYDQTFFANRLTDQLRQADSPPVEFRLSNRMTRAAGKTIFQRERRRVGIRVVEVARYQIAISSLLLFQTFRDGPDPGQRPPRAIEVAGVVCVDRLAALLRIFEHELLHLAEFLVDGRSNCQAEPFRRLSRAIFGHSTSVHSLMTPVESAAEVYAIRLGDRVAFDQGGLERVGLVRRITRRASVLVPDGAGRLYSDGVRYTTYLVPLNQLRKV